MISLGTVRDTREEGRVELDLGTPVVIELTKKTNKPGREHCTVLGLLKEMQLECTRHPQLKQKSPTNQRWLWLRTEIMVSEGTKEQNSRI